MITERSAPDLEQPDVFRCLNCGTVIVGPPEDESRTEIERHAGRDLGPGRPRAVSAVDQFITRQNIAIYKRQLARESDSARRAVLLNLLDIEKAKQTPGGRGRRDPD